MFDFTLIQCASLTGAGHSESESRAVLDSDGIIYTVGFGTDHKHQSSGYCAMVQDKGLNLLRCAITGTIAGYNYFSDWSAYK